jgi:glutathione S-transferase
LKLYYAPTSPYARKVRMVVIEKGLQDRVETVVAIPYEGPPALQAANPLGKVPALVTDDGRAIFDSPVICAYLNSLASEQALIPDGSERWRVLTNEALCDGILDAALGIVMEGRRPEAQRSPDWLDRWPTAILRSLDAVEAKISGFEGDLTIAQLCLGAALGYLDFRLPDLSWRSGRPNTKAWFDAFSRRESMIETNPEKA